MARRLNRRECAKWHNRIQSSASCSEPRFALAMRHCERRLSEPFGPHRFANEGADRRRMRPSANGDEIHLAPEFRLDQWTGDYAALRDGKFRHETEPEACDDHGQDPIVAVAAVDGFING